MNTQAESLCKSFLIILEIQTVKLLKELERKRTNSCYFSVINYFNVLNSDCCTFTYIQHSQLLERPLGLTCKRGVIMQKLPAVSKKKFFSFTCHVIIKLMSMMSVMNVEPDSYSLQSHVLLYHAYLYFQLALC